MSTYVLESEGRQVYQIECDDCGFRGPLSSYFEEAKEGFIQTSAVYHPLVDVPLLCHTCVDQRIVSYHTDWDLEKNQPQELPPWCTIGALLKWVSRSDDTLRVIAIKERSLLMRGSTGTMEVWDRRATMPFDTLFQQVHARTRFSYILESSYELC